MTVQSNDPPGKPKRQKPKSRSKRWAEAVSDALKAIEEIESKLDDLETAVSELHDVQGEYEEWRDNMSENLRSSAMGEKLDTVCDIEIEDLASTLREAVEEAKGKIEEANEAELPQGFGRD